MGRTDGRVMESLSRIRDLALELASRVLGGDVGERGAVLAHGILGLGNISGGRPLPERNDATLGGVDSGPLGDSRVFARGLVAGRIYLTVKMPSKEVLNRWTFRGLSPGDASKMEVCFLDSGYRVLSSGVSVVLLGDHGLASYDRGGLVWHPENWSLATGHEEGFMDRVMKEINRASREDVEDPVSVPGEDYLA